MRIPYASAAFIFLLMSTPGLAQQGALAANSLSLANAGEERLDSNEDAKSSRMGPSITQTSPNDVQISAHGLVISASFADADVDLDPASIVFEVDGVDVTGDIDLRMDSPRSGGLTYRPPEALRPGRHRVELQVSNTRVIGAYEIWGFWVEREPQYDVVLLFPDEGVSLTASRVTIGVRLLSNGPLSKEVSIQGRPTRSSNYRDGGLHFVADVELKQGANRIEVVATFDNGASIRKTFNFQRVIAP